MNKRLMIMKKSVTVFHFTQPSKKKIIGYWEKICRHGAVLCFDFEDILMDLSSHSYSEDEREILRSAIAETLKELFRQTNNPQIGVRLNNISSIYFEKDLRTLKHIGPKYFLNSIFLPKSETPDEISAAIEALHTEGISFREIIPIIETKRGMENITNILSLPDINFRKIAFGHCDFNLDHNYFPFYHQNTEKYWEWIRQILSHAENYNKMFINSPYLRLNDTFGFSKMIMKLRGMTSSEVGQITLTEKQTKLCADNQNTQVLLENSFPVSRENKHKMAEEIISEFENNKVREQSISINKEKVLISPHEYAAAVQYMNNHAGDMIFENNHYPGINMLIAGGCFPVQDNIKEQDLYHQIIREKMMREYGIHLSIDILRYENIKNCLELIKERVESRKPDCLLFHIRVEPVLPKVKLYNVYTDRAGRIKRSIRIFSKIILTTTQENRNTGTIASAKTPGKMHNFLRELNYLSGILAFNCITLRKDYLNLINEIAEYCKSKDIEPIITGPVSRPRSYFENLISEKIDGFISGHRWRGNKQYINFLGLENERGEFLFCEDLIKVNEEGHRRIADLIIRLMTKSFRMPGMLKHKKALSPAP